MSELLSPEEIQNIVNNWQHELMRTPEKLARRIAKAQLAKRLDRDESSSQFHCMRCGMTTKTEAPEGKIIYSDGICARCKESEKEIRKSEREKIIQEFRNKWAWEGAHGQAVFSLKLDDWIKFVLDAGITNTDWWELKENNGN